MQSVWESETFKYAIYPKIFTFVIGLNFLLFATKLPLCTINTRVTQVEIKEGKECRHRQRNHHEILYDTSDELALHIASQYGTGLPQIKFPQTSVMGRREGIKDLETHDFGFLTTLSTNGRLNMKWKMPRYTITHLISHSVNNTFILAHA